MGVIMEWVPEIQWKRDHWKKDHLRTEKLGYWMSHQDLCKNSDGDNDSEPRAKAIKEGETNVETLRYWVVRSDDTKCKAGIFK